MSTGSHPEHRVVVYRVGLHWDWELREVDHGGYVILEAGWAFRKRRAEHEGNQAFVRTVNVYAAVDAAIYGTQPEPATQEPTTPEPSPTPEYLTTAEHEAMKLTATLADLAAIQAAGFHRGQTLPPTDRLEIVNGWLVERGAHPQEYPAGPAYGPQPYSDAEPILHLSELPGWPDATSHRRRTLMEAANDLEEEFGEQIPGSTQRLSTPSSRRLRTSASESPWSEPNRGERHRTLADGTIQSQRLCLYGCTHCRAEHTYWPGTDTSYVWWKITHADDCPYKPLTEGAHIIDRWIAQYEDEHPELVIETA